VALTEAQIQLLLLPYRFHPHPSEFKTEKLPSYRHYTHNQRNFNIFNNFLISTLPYFYYTIAYEFQSS